MLFGVHLPHLGQQGDREVVMRFAREAEQLGFDSVWTSDHIAWPSSLTSRYPYSESGDFPAPAGVPWLDAIGTLLFVAGCTERVRLGTTVLILGYRPPVQTAKLLATLDVLSRGRTILGVGVGWMREEFEVLGMPFDHRGARADEQLELFEALFSQPTPSYAGRYYKLPPVGFQPKPVQGHIPLWVGGDTEAAFRRAARYGDGFHAAFTPPATLGTQWQRVQALCRELGRDPNALTLSARVHLGPAERVNQASGLYGEPDQMVARIAEYRSAGASYLLLDPVAPGGVEGRLQAMRRFMAEVAPRVMPA